MSAVTRFAFPLVASLLLAACGDGDDPSGGTTPVIPDDRPRIVGSVFDAATGQPIRDALVSSDPVTEEVSSGADGTYALLGASWEGGEFRVFVTHPAYEGADARAFAGPGETARVDFSLDGSATGLAVSPATVIIPNGESAGSFRLTSTVANTGFSIETPVPWASVSRRTGTIVNRETAIITVDVDREALGGAGNAELVINPDNGTGAAFVNVLVEADAAAPPAGVVDTSRQSECRRADVFRVGLPDPSASLVQFVDSVSLPEQAGLVRSFRIPAGAPVLFDSIEVRALGTVSVEHASGGPESTVMELFELDTGNSIVSLAESGEFDVAGARARVEFAVLPGVYCFYVADSAGAFAPDTEVTLRYGFEPPR